MATGPAPISGVLNHFQILQELGAGGMGVVYKALDLRLGRLVALKLLPVEFASTEEAKRRFDIEARAASALDHINVGTIYGIEETGDGRRLIVMAFYEGETLAAKIARGPIDLRVALLLARQIADAIAAAHQKRIVHRDIKPSNIIVTPENVVKVVDFGIARLDIGPALTRTGQIVGTLHYMSPEQALGASVDNRTDVWSAGIVLFEMVTGRRPFAAETAQAIFCKIVKDPLPEVRSPLGSALNRVLQKAAAKDPAARYTSSDQFSADLAVLEQKVVTLQAGGQSLFARIKSEQRLFSAQLRRRTILAVMFAGIVVASILFPFFRKTADPKIPSNVNDEYRQAAALLDHRENSNDINRSIHALQQCLRTDPTFALAYAKLGQAYLYKYWVTQNLSLLQLARESSGRALALSNSIPTAYVTLGMLDSGAGQHELAIQDFQRALVLDPTDIEAYQGISQAYDAIGRSKDAETMLRKAIALSPDSWQSHSRLGKFLFDHQRFRDAVTEYREVIRLAPRNAYAYSNLGGAELELGHTREGISLLEHSVELAPSYAALSNLGTAYYGEGDLRRAIFAYDRAAKMNGQDLNLLANIAVCRRRLHGMDSETVSAYQRARKAAKSYLQANARDIEAMGVLANLDVWLDERAEADQLCNEMLALAPRDSEAELNAASVYAQEGRKEDAISLVKSALAHGASKQRIATDDDLKALLTEPTFQTHKNLRP